MENFIVTMTPARVDEFKKLILSFNRRAAKHEVDPIEIIDVQNTTKKMNGVVYRLVDVTINRPRFTLGNYRIDAVHTNKAGYDVTYTYNDYCHDINDGVDYTRCDHCGAKRHRNMVLTITSGDQHLQVGSTCVQDFMGVSLSAFKWFSDKLSMIYAEEWDEDFASNAPRVYDVHSVLAYTFMTCSIDGYKKTSDDIPSGIIVKNSLIDGVKLTPKSLTWATDAIDIIQAMTPTNTYEQNIFNIVSAGHVANQDINILVSSYVMVTREMQKREGSNEGNSDHVGEIGQRFTFTGTITLAYGRPTAFGYSVMYIIKDGGGNEFKWVSTSPNHQDYQSGSTYEFKGTIDAHDVYNGTNQTILKRCKVKEV